MAQNFLTGINIVGDALSISGTSAISSARHAAFVNLTTTVSQNERSAQESEFAQSALSFDNPYQIYIH